METSSPTNPAKPATWAEWKTRTGRRWWRYPLAIEWALEWFVYRLRRLALFDLLELAGKLTVLVAIIFWFLEADNRAKERHYRAWELINAARGSTGDGGRKDALQDLNKDGVSLAAAPLDKAYLAGVDLQRAELLEANLQEANLQDANLQEAELAFANLQDANFQNANLQGAFLQHANLQGTFLVGANLQGADLWSDDLQGADLRGANLQKTRNLTQEQLDAAWGDDQTQLPAGLTRPAHWFKPKVPKAPPTAGAPGSGK